MYTWYKPLAIVWFSLEQHDAIDQCTDAKGNWFLQHPKAA